MAENEPLTGSGEFEIVNWDEETIFPNEGLSKLNMAKVVIRYGGDLVGTSKIVYQLCYNESGDANFVGFEYFAGQYLTQSCQAVFRHKGLFKQGTAISEFCVTDSDSPNLLVGQKGKFVASLNGKAEYTLYQANKFD